MARKQKSGGRSGLPKATTADWTYRLVCISAFAVPLTISLDGRDSFRLPKELVFRAEMIVLAALLLAGLALRELDWKKLRWRHPAVVLTLATVAWTAVTAAASTNRGLSGPALAYACGTALVFLATLLIAHRGRLGMLRWIAWAGLINSILYLAVALRLMKNPLTLDAAYRGHNAATAFLGNANDVGSAILPIAICATAAALSSKEHRSLFATTVVLATGTVLVSASVAAIGALLVALGTLALVWNWKRALVVMVVVTLFLGVLAVAHQPLNYRLRHMAKAARTAQWDELSSGRLTAFTAAIEMFRDHPITGVGPGVFGWQYYPYKLEVSERNPDLYDASAASRFNFEEAHNDHLEVLAETGVPGYLLFLSALVFVASGSLRRPRPDPGEDDRARFARLAPLPLATGVAVIALAQYPLQLTSSLTTLVFLTALCVAWRTDLEPAITNGGEADA